MKTTNRKNGERARGASSLALRRMVAMAVFSALAYGVTFVFHFKIGFLTFDAKDAVLAVAALIYGPVAGVIMSLLTSLLELVTVSDTGFYGFVMNFASSAAFSAVAAGLYRLRRRPSHAIVSLYAAAVSMTGVMMLLNILITPLYMGAPREQVVALIPTFLLPFNAAKGLLNAALALILYKPVVTALRRSGLLSARTKMPATGTTGTTSPAPDRTAAGHGYSLRNTLLIALVAAITLAGAVVWFVYLHNHPPF